MHEGAGNRDTGAIVEYRWAHSVFGNLEIWLRGTFHGISPTHLQRTSTSSATGSSAAGGRASSLASAYPCVARGQPLPCRLLVAEGTA